MRHTMSLYVMGVNPSEGAVTPNPFNGGMADGDIKPQGQAL